MAQAQQWLKTLRQGVKADYGPGWILKVSTTASKSAELRLVTPDTAKRNSFPLTCHSLAGVTAKS